MIEQAPDTLPYNPRTWGDTNPVRFASNSSVDSGGSGRSDFETLTMPPQEASDARAIPSEQPLNCRAMAAESLGNAQEMVSS